MNFPMNTQTTRTISVPSTTGPGWVYATETTYGTVHIGGAGYAPAIPRETETRCRLALFVSAVTSIGLVALGLVVNNCHNEMCSYPPASIGLFCGAGAVGSVGVVSLMAVFHNCLRTESEIDRASKEQKEREEREIARARVRASSI